MVKIVGIKWFSPALAIRQSGVKIDKTIVGSGAIPAEVAIY
jgi:hypothetical protein